jgi:hypothetical protein
MVEKERNGKQRVKNAEKAEEILELMVNFVNEKANTCPGLLAGFNACMDTWARSRVSEGAPRCEALLHRIVNDEEMKPNVISFNSCLYGKRIGSRCATPNVRQSSYTTVSFVLSLVEIEQVSPRFCEKSGRTSQLTK